MEMAPKYEDSSTWLKVGERGRVVGSFYLETPGAHPQPRLICGNPVPALSCGWQIMTDRRTTAYILVTREFESSAVNRGDYE